MPGKLSQTSDGVGGSGSAARGFGQGSRCTPGFGGLSNDTIMYFINKLFTNTGAVLGAGSRTCELECRMGLIN